MIEHVQQTYYKAKPCCYSSNKPLKQLFQTCL